VPGAREFVKFLTIVIEECLGSHFGRIVILTGAAMLLADLNGLVRDPWNGRLPLLLFRLVHFGDLICSLVSDSDGTMQGRCPDGKALR